LKQLAVIKASSLAKEYRLYDIDISRFIKGVEEFELLEDSDGLRFWQPAITGDSAFYGDLCQNIPWYYSPEKEEFKVARKFIKPGPLLEIGCGEGLFAIKENIPEFTGIEINETAARKAISKGLNVHIEDFEEYSRTHSMCAKTICSFQVLEHLPSPDIFFKSCYKLLQEDGILITSVPCEDSFISTLESNCLNAPPHHITRWTDNCLKTLPSKYGFECIKLIHIPIEPCHYGWFWSSLIDKSLQQAEHGKGRIKNLKLKVAMKMLNFLGATNYVPKEFNIPGHTVLAVHKKA